MNLSAIFHIEIPKRSTACARGQELFVPGMEFYSTLKDNIEQEGYARQDFCPSCWKKLASQITLEPISTWKSKVPQKKTPSELPRQRDARAMYLLKEALMSNAVDDYAEVFVLAMYLARRRLIYFRQDLLLENGQHASIYEVADTEEMLCIPKLPLSTLPIEEIQRKLAAKLSLKNAF